jgi:dolichyl-phosphate beta-glucosyltransferase
MEPTAIVIPCYNEAFRFDARVFIGFLEAHAAIDLCFVDDGSTDNTAGMLKEMAEQVPARVIVCNLDKNSGKAEAVRKGINECLQNSKYEYVAYFDADLATPLEEIFLLYEYIKRNDRMVFSFGSRFARIGSRIERQAYRHFLGRVIATFISGILKLKVYDTQCGAKLITAPMARQVFQQPFISKWLFDVEIFARILEIYGRDNIEGRIIEVPLNIWIEKGDSRISPTYAFILPFDLLKIWKHYKAK